MARRGDSPKRRAREERPRYEADDSTSFEEPPAIYLELRRPRRFGNHTRARRAVNRIRSRGKSEFSLLLPKLRAICLFVNRKSLLGFRAPRLGRKTPVGGQNVCRSKSG